MDCEPEGDRALHDEAGHGASPIMACFRAGRELR